MEWKRREHLSRVTPKQLKEAIAMTTGAYGVAYLQATLIEKFKDKYKIGELWKIIREAYEVAGKWRSLFGNRTPDELASAIRHVEAWKRDPALKDLKPDGIRECLELAKEWDSFHTLKEHDPHEVANKVDRRAWWKRFLAWYSPLLFDNGSQEANELQARLHRSIEKSAKGLGHGYWEILTRLPEVMVPLSRRDGRKIKAYTDLGSMVLDAASIPTDRPKDDPASMEKAAKKSKQQ